MSIAMSESEAFFDRQVNLEKTGEFKYGRTLSRMRSLLELCSNPDRSIPYVILVAGSKGKGSTAEMIAKLLQYSGLKVGSYSSPHLLTWTERIKVDGRNIDESNALQLIERYFKTRSARSLKPSPTYFEWMTALAWLYFRSQHVDVAIMEVGLGGRMDATNVCTPNLSVITPIGLEHQVILGDTLPKIAFEKCGIMRTGVKTVVSSQNPEALETIKATAKKIGSGICLSELESQRIEIIKSSEGMRCQLEHKRIGKLSFELNLFGDHQIVNMKSAISAASHCLNHFDFELTPFAVKEAARNIELLGRVQVLSRDPLWVADGAHNVDSTESLVQSIQDHLSFKRAHLVLGAFRDKDISGMIRVLKRLPIACVYAVTVASERARESSEVLEFVRKEGLQVRDCQGLTEARMQINKNFQLGDMCLVTGSMYLAGEAIEVMKEQKYAVSA